MCGANRSSVFHRPKSPTRPREHSTQRQPIAPTSSSNSRERRNRSTANMGDYGGYSDQYQYDNYDGAQYDGYQYDDYAQPDDYSAQQYYGTTNSQDDYTRQSGIREQTRRRSTARDMVSFSSSRLREEQSSTILTFAKYLRAPLRFRLPIENSPLSAVGAQNSTLVAFLPPVL